MYQKALKCIRMETRRTTSGRYRKNRCEKLFRTTRSIFTPIQKTAFREPFLSSTRTKSSIMLSSIASRAGWLSEGLIILESAQTGTNTLKSLIKRRQTLWSTRMFINNNKRNRCWRVISIGLRMKENRSSWARLRVRVKHSQTKVTSKRCSPRVTIW